ncbi:MAG: O-linked N-acetylglucosamine transferase, SPINDLY family protein [Microcystaceae cyanobacterium]
MTTPTVDPSLDFASQVQDYQSQIEKEPENLLLYWQLGLIYLLQNSEEQGRDVWFYALAQNLAIADVNLQGLLNFLEAQAIQYEEVGELERVWQICGQIQSLEPGRLNNLLLLIDVGERLQKFKLSELELVQSLLSDPREKSPDPSLLSRAVLTVLRSPTTQAIQFLAASLPYLQNSPNTLGSILGLANEMAYLQRRPTYGAAIAEVCLQFSPGNLYILNELLNFHQLSNKEEALVQTAWQLYRAVESKKLDVASECYWFSRILTTLLRGHYWLEINPILERFQTALDKLLQTSKVELNPLLRDRFWGLGYPLLYLFDDPVKNRLCFNKIAQIFQDNINPHYQDNSKTFTIQINSAKPLRIGYIAHTLYQHSAGWLTRWLYHYHDKQEFQLYFYLLNQPEDDLTRAWIYPNAHKVYHFTQDAQAIAAQIEADHLHILVDLDSITNNLTAQILARKPAPIQVNWIGFEASGLPTIDYYIVDRFIVPENAQQDYREKLWHLPCSCICVDGFEVGQPSISREQLGISENSVVYLNFQNKLKYHPDILRLQLEIIKAVPHSIFLIQGDRPNEKFQDYLQSICEQVNLDPQRLKYLPKQSELIHRANLKLADVVLDTYPYNGCTTSLEALWMEIPLVTKVGQQFVARNSYAFLQQLGISEGIAWTDREYLDWGIRFGLDRELRTTVKEKLAIAKLNSPLWQAENFTKEMEKAYRQMWKSWTDLNPLNCP